MKAFFTLLTLTAGALVACDQVGGSGLHSAKGADGPWQAAGVIKGPNNWSADIYTLNSKDGRVCQFHFESWGEPADVHCTRIPEKKP